MKKLISVVLVLAMLASMMVYLPLGASAEESAAPETIYSEDFTGKDGTYTLAELATKMGWTLLRGDDAATATIADGVLSITSGAKDVVFLMDTDVRYKANHTYEYDMTMCELGGGDLFFAAIYTGTDNGETTKAVIDKMTYEGYNHLTLVNGSINEGNINAGGFKIRGTGYEQARAENIRFGGGYDVGNRKTTTTWKVVYDVVNNQVDAYASGGRINSTAGNAEWEKYNVADYVGEGAYLRVQKGREAKFDNISFVVGGNAIVKNTNVVYNQNFDALPEGTYSGNVMAEMIGFQSLLDTSKNNKGTAKMEYSIKNGRFEILAVPSDGKTPSDVNFNQQGLFGYLYIPEMEKAKDRVVIEYDMTYLYDSTKTGSLNNGDTPISFEMYGRRGDFQAAWQFTQKGFPFYGFRNGSYTVDGTKYYPNSYGINSTSGNGQPCTMGRWESTAFNAPAKTYAFSNQTSGYGHSIINSTEHITAVLDYDTGMTLYVNGVIALQMTTAQLETWTTTKGTARADHSDIVGNILRLRIAQGGHVALDNFTVTVDAPVEGGLRITEWNNGTNAAGYSTQGGSEYLEVYNSSVEAINIYDYAVLNVFTSNSMDQFGKAVGLNNIHLMYPGTHTFKSIKTDAEGKPLYTYDITNPSYEEGWIQPGETVILWNKTDSMHNGSETGPSVVEATGMGNWGAVTVEMFRKGLSLPETTKVFQMYNDYNRAFNGSGDYMVALADRSVYQPNYDPETASGDETLANAVVKAKDLECMVYCFHSINNAICQIKTGAYTRFAYAATVDGIVPAGRTTSTAVAADMTPGLVENDQKRAFTVTANGKKNTAYLGEAIKPMDYVTLEGFQQALFVKVDGVVVDASKPITVLADIAIEVGDIVALSTAPGASLRINYDESGDVIFGMRWLTAINTADLEALIAKYGKENVEIGTLIARTEELTDAEQALAIENVYDEDTAYDKVVRKAVAYAGEWYPATSDYEGFAIFAGGVGNMHLDYNAMKEYVAVGYISVTIDGETYTLYGAADTTAQTKVIYDMMGEALGDYEENDAAGTPENSILTAEEYELVNEAYWNI